MSTSIALLAAIFIDMQPSPPQLLSQAVFCHVYYWLLTFAHLVAPKGAVLF